MRHSKTFSFISAFILRGWMCRASLHDNLVNEAKDALGAEASSLGDSRNELSATDSRESHGNLAVASVDHLLENGHFNVQESPDQKCHAEWMGGINAELSESESKDRGWYSMIKSVGQLEKDYGKIDVEKYEQTHTDAIMETIVRLKSLHEQMETLFGPHWDPEVHASRPQYLKVKYTDSIWRLYEILRSGSNYPKPIHHLKVARNSCILETINFIRRYSLAHDDDLEDLEWESSREGGLRWLVRAIDGVFKTDTEIWNEYHFHPTVEEHIQYHLHMQHIYNSYKFLAKQEQDFVLFTLAINDYGIEESAECWKDGPITKPFSKPMIELIYFMRKVRRFIKDALEDEGPGELERKAFFLEVKDDLMEMRRFYFDPRVPPGHDREEFIKVFHFRAAALRFIHQRIGADYINEPECEEYKEDTAGVDARFQLYYLLQAHSEWRYILLYYAHYASNAMTRGKSAEVPARVRREIGTVLWGRIAETAAAYRKLKTAQSKRLEEISAHITYRDIVEKHDRMVKDLPTLKHTFDSLVDGP